MCVCVILSVKLTSNLNVAFIFGVFVTLFRYFMDSKLISLSHVSFNHIYLPYMTQLVTLIDRIDRRLVVLLLQFKIVYLKQ